MDTLLEITATIFGFLSVYFTIKQNIWCWYFGLIQVILFCFIFYKAKLYSDMILHFIYIFLQIFGWYSWKFGGSNKSELKISLVKNIYLYIAITIFGTIGLGYFMTSKTDASLPYPDAFITIASLVAQYLMIKKLLPSWYFWIIVDVVAIGIYFYKDLYYTSALYFLFLIMAIFGLFAWRKTYYLNLKQTT